MSKYIYMLLVSSTLLFCINSCSESEAMAPKITDTQFNADRLVADYKIDEGQTYGSELREPFTAKGKVVFAENRVKPNGDLHLVMTFEMETPKGHIEYLQFDFGLYDEIEFPGSISSVRLTFLNHQLIVQDLESDFAANLFVKVFEHTKNYVDRLTPVEGYGLSISRIDADLAKSAGGCSCSCDKCDPLPAPCGSAECSCGSPCGDCSTVCRPGYNASCLNGCNEQ
ncbi:hypothetical protein GGR26_001743 [Lewinella marina]|uniref:hypothetical protein n=1 Tax=Neolewinella marina TaxID=438751 RepID=UPI001179A411|nr:hypothetical protein [Neolewinella marina]NJB85975.1 hypothetical protein [Neolewinella marina]